MLSVFCLLRIPIYITYIIDTISAVLKLNIITLYGTYVLLKRKKKSRLITINIRIMQNITQTNYYSVTAETCKNALPVLKTLQNTTEF